MNTNNLSSNRHWLKALGLSCAAACTALAACDGGSINAISGPPTTDAGGDAPSVTPARDAGADGPSQANDGSTDSGGDAMPDAPDAFTVPDGTMFRYGSGFTINGMTSDGYLVYSDANNIRYSTLSNPLWDGIALKVQTKQTAIVGSILLVWDTNTGVLTLVQGGKVFPRNVGYPAADLTTPIVSPDESTVAWMETAGGSTTGKNLVVSRLAQGDRTVSTALTDVSCIDRFELASNNALFVGHCGANQANLSVTLSMVSPPAVPKDLYTTVLAGSWAEDPTGAWAWADTNPLDTTMDPANETIQVVRAADGQTAALPALSKVFDPSGSWLYYSDKTHTGLYRMARSTLVSTLVTSGACTTGGVYRISPDGRFALCSNSSTTPATRDLVSTDSGAVTNLGVGSCFFTSDSAYVWCAAAGPNVNVFSTATGAKTAQIAGGTSVMATADGKYLVAKSSGGYSAIAADGSSAALVAIAVNDAQHSTLLSLTGSNLLQQDGDEIRVVDAAGKVATKVLTRQLSLDGGWALSPDKTQVAYVTTASAPGIYLLSTQ